MKEMIKRTAACLLFAGLAAGMLYGAYRLLHFKSTDGCYPAEMFYQQEENTVDVLCLGSSHTYTNINPAILWDEYGMAAYDLAGSNQTLWNTYYYMKEALKYQTPQLVVVDVYRVMEEDEYQGTERMTMNMFGLRHSDDYVENLQVSLAPEEEQLDYLLRYPVYHARYQELKEDDFLPYHGDANGRNYKGFNINSISTTVFEGLPDVTWVTETGKMEKKNEKYLKEIIDLAKEQDIPLLLVAAPYMEVGEEDEMLYNQVAEIAAEHQVDFVDFNRQFEQIGLDPQKDFAESSHLNYYGSEKYTSYLGNYIAKHFKVSDRRGDKRYDSWEANSRYYEKHAQNVDLKKTTDANAYFKKLFANTDRYTICVMTKGDYRSQKWPFIKSMLKKYGMDPDTDTVWIWKDGELQMTVPADTTEDKVYYQDLGRKSVTVLTEERYSAMLDDTYLYREVSIEGINCDAAENGINIMVYDNELQEMVDNAGMNASDGYAFMRY